MTVKLMSHSVRLCVSSPLNTFQSIRACACSLPMGQCATQIKSERVPRTFAVETSGSGSQIAHHKNTLNYFALRCVASSNTPVGVRVCHIVVAYISIKVLLHHKWHRNIYIFTLQLLLMAFWLHMKLGGHSTFFYDRSIASAYVSFGGGI